MNSTSAFIHALTNQVYKIIPLAEAEANGADCHLVKYIDSIVVSMDGAMHMFGELNANGSYLSVLCTLRGIREISEFKTIRSEILRCLKVLNFIEKQVGGDRT